MLKYILLALLFVSTNSFAQTSRAGTVSFVRGTAGIEVKEVSSVQTIADVAGALGGKSFVIYSALNAVKYGIWIDVDNGSTAPTITGATLVEVDIATGDTAVTVATNIKTSLDAVTGTPFVTTRLTDTLTITNSGYGVTTDIADVDSGFTISKTTDGVSAADAILDANIIANHRGFTICNDAVNTSNYLQIGFGTVITTTGTRLGKGECFVCGECKRGILDTLRVSSEAAANGYGIIQYRN